MEIWYKILIIKLVIIQRNKVQTILNEKKVKWVTNRQLDYLFGGLLYCHECGRNIRISEDILKSGVRHYTQCNLYTRKGKYGICSSHRINYDWLEEDILEYLQDVCEKFCKYYEFNDLEDNSENIVMKNLKEINQKIKKLNNVFNSYKSTIDNLYMDKVKGLIDEETFKRIYDKIQQDIFRVIIKIDELNKKKQINEKQASKNTGFSRCKHSVLDYMSLKNPTKDQIKRLIERIEIDKDKNIYVHLNFPKLT